MSNPNAEFQGELTHVGGEQALSLRSMARDSR